ncbi:MAG: formylglycine-generating enzyme family protein [Phycisphaeraceae bacterium]|nr:formylglycine-generating enzyme family protein [Phycisphaeraceae bacterium]
MRSHRDVLFVLCVCLGPGPMGARALAEPPVAAAGPGAVSRAGFSQEIPSAAYKIVMVPIPGDDAKGIKPFAISATEVTWDAFDVYAYGLDVPRGDDGQPMPSTKADGVTRPSKPYLPPDRGFGHDGFAAICVSFENAKGFCDWLSARSGKTYRLATEAEWEHACLAGATTRYHFGDDATRLGDYAWYYDNTDGAPRAAGTRKPNAWGLFDMHGNVAEWVMGRDGKPVTKGGSFRDDAQDLIATARRPQSPAWNASDPQMPKSQWWLADAPFVGFRIVCEVMDEAADGPTPEESKE